MPTHSQRLLEAVAKRAAARSSDPTRHKCFISYHQEDEDEAEAFIDTNGDIFIAEVLGVSDEDDFIDSDDTDYVMRRIRELYLTDSTVTIVLVGSARGPGNTSTGRSPRRCETTLRTSEADSLVSRCRQPLATRARSLRID